jgi:hypothetical protein
VGWRRRTAHVALMLLLAYLVVALVAGGGVLLSF